MIDAYDNIIKSYSGKFQLTCYITDITGMIIPSYIQQAYDGNSTYQLLSFSTSIAGDLVLHVEEDNESVIGSPFTFYVDPGTISPSACQGLWPSNFSLFRNADTATFHVLYMDSYNNTILNVSVAVNISANIKAETGSGNASILNIDLNGGPGYGTIDFVSFSSGNFFLEVMVNDVEISESPFAFQISSGVIDASNCFGEWTSANSTFEAGIYPSFEIVQKDEFNNTLIDSIFDNQIFDFDVSSVTDEGSPYELANLTFLISPDDGLGTVQFLATDCGNFSLHVTYNGTEIKGSPFRYVVVPGPISVEQCIGFWDNEIGVYGAADMISLLLLLEDAYGNNITATASALAKFTLQTKSVAGVDYSINMVSTPQNNSVYGVITFTNRKAGEYLLYISINSSSVEGSPFSYIIEPGVLSPAHCQVVWLNKSTSINAGSQGSVEVLFVDAYNNSVSSYINVTMFFTRDGNSFDDVSLSSRRQQGLQHIDFIITLSGNYLFHLVDGASSDINGSPVGFSIIPASVLPSNCKGVWVDDKNTFQSGESGSLKVFLMDAYNNLVSASSDAASNLAFSAFTTCLGHCVLYVLINQIQMGGSPFPFTYVTGQVYVPYCIGYWANGTNVFERDGQGILNVMLKDEINTTLSSTANVTFSKLLVVDLIGRATKMIPKLTVSEPGLATVMFKILPTFNSSSKGSFFLRIGDTSAEIQGSPFLFTVLQGIAWRSFH
ncbi:hypothetical protein KP509_01G014500 [Ceratopteris richardii]|uniref:GEX2 N-terminal Ig-like domain-containing protein n=1 Tax=Ceratopteris richardii TaxID=49495 RepID=A0A8T2VDY0_CERRI|nr:hypothetical protein KP509_01G014500 [Ceratopteris richardii]